MRRRNGRGRYTGCSGGFKSAIQSDRIAGPASRPFCGRLVGVSAGIVEIPKLYFDVNINGQVEESDGNDDEISRYPGKSKAVPKWANRKVTECTLRNVGIHMIGKRQGSH